MFWIDTFSKSYAVWFCGEQIDEFDSIEEAEEFLEEMQKTG